MADPQTDLVALVGSRLCHDLISPLGAIGNGVELLAMSGVPASPEMELIAESVRAANTRIRFFRIAFGQAVPEQRVSQREIRAILDDMARTGRTRIRWEVEGDLSRQEVKLTFLAILCLESALPRGGDIIVSQTADGWRIDAQGAQIRTEPDFWAQLSADTGTLPPAQVQFALLPREARLAGRNLLHEVTDNRVVLGF
ncbi:histidine phosphotransferase family protein [Sinirhodobacter sp. WL0062]|uniref:Histidine phosphotransferase family protein n=2 Tax=Rhodobacter flavimaris TaxID=2907145 RepID=A0ABS8YVD7_9RHOB|nr:histidine phosphotransferase family protein [Sinirhodobacter sp. WL0062]